MMVIPLFSFCPEQENYLINPQKKLIGDDEHGWTNENTVFILKAVAMLK
jgi:hypothetical protein